jgi:hypothetical protein
MVLGKWVLLLLVHEDLGRRAQVRDRDLFKGGQRVRPVELVKVGLLPLPHRELLVHLRQASHVLVKVWLASKEELQ